MRLKGLLRWFTSARVTVTLLVLLALLLLLNVALPQESVLGEERYERLLQESGRGARFVLDTLGLGHMSTSPVFLATLGLFFLNLTAVLLSRIGPTWRRIALRERSEEGLRAWARMEESLSGGLPGEWSPGRVAQVLRGFGFQVRRQGERTFWGVKHRTAPLGFLLFHLSFFLLFDFEQTRAQNTHGDFAVAVLGFFLLADYAYAGRLMSYTNRRVSGIYALAARAGSAKYVNTQL